MQALYQNREKYFNNPVREKKKKQQWNDKLIASWK